VRTIEVPETGGQRIFNHVAGPFADKMVAEIIRESHPELESKLPSKDVPGDMLSDLYSYDNTKSVEVIPDGPS
jgi:hypothetical protein